MQYNEFNLLEVLLKGGTETSSEDAANETWFAGRVDTPW